MRYAKMCNWILQKNLSRDIPSRRSLFKCNFISQVKYKEKVPNISRKHVTENLFLIFEVIHVIENLFLIFGVIAHENVGTLRHVGTRARKLHKHARHLCTWARKHARQVGTCGPKHARFAGTWARKTRKLAYPHFP